MCPRVIWVHDSIGCWIDSRHPDTCLVYLEQVCDKVVEVDVLLGVIEESEFSIIAICCEQIYHFLQASRAYC